jgi:hypothetical protein
MGCERGPSHPKTDKSATRSMTMTRRLSTRWSGGGMEVWTAQRMTRVSTTLIRKVSMDMDYLLNRY